MEILEHRDSFFEDSQIIHSDNSNKRKNMNSNSGFDNPENYICITVYNENYSLVSLTLRSILLGLETFYKDSLNCHKAKSCIFIVIDGDNKICPDVRDFLFRCELLHNDLELEISENIFHFSSHISSTLLHELDKSILCLNCGVEVNFVVCIKPKNRGKLDSHRLFFGDLCMLQNPKYCYQIDAGTVIDQYAISHMVDYFESQPNVGALASKITSPVPHSCDGILQTWQFMDFVEKQSLDWPADALTGHLSVLPGQYCAIRWLAFAPSAKAEEGEYNSVSNSDNPMQRYLRGMHAENNFDRLMFLAEDRVIGNEIVMAKDSAWKLDFCVNAMAITDSCKSMMELMRQRRRWHNSSITCRLWIVLRLPNMWTRTDRSLRQKFRFSFAMLWQVFYLMLQAIQVSGACSLWIAIFYAIADTGPVLQLATFGSAIVAWFFMLYPPKRIHENNRDLYTIGRDIAVFVFVIFLLISMGLSFGRYGIILLLLPMLLFFIMFSVSFPHNRFTIFRRFPQYWIIDPFMKVILITYAIVKLDDISWGTKGLTRSTEININRKLFFKQKMFALFCWLTINFLITYIGLKCVGLIIPHFNPVFAIFSIINNLIFVPASIMFLVVKQHKNKFHSKYVKKL